VLGPIAVSMIAGVMMLSSFGSLQTSILGTARVPFAMARDRLFFQSLARVSPRACVPLISLIVQGIWSAVLALSGTFDQLTDYAIFASGFLWNGDGRRVCFPPESARRPATI